MRFENNKRHFDKNAPRREKIRLIFFPYLVVMLSITVVGSFAYWYFVYEHGWRSDMVSFVVLIAMVGLPILLLQRRFNLIERKKEGHNRLLDMVCIIPMVIALMAANNYIDDNVGKLTQLQDLAEIGDYPPSRFYTIENLTYTNPIINDFTYVESAGGRTKKKQLETYCVAPFYSASHSNPSTWIGQLYISNAFDPEYQQEYLDYFVPKSVERFRQETGIPFQYLERITLSPKSGYYRALRLAGTDPREIIMLRPHYKPFEARAGNSLNVALLACIIGMGLFLIVVLVYPFNEKRLRCFITGERYCDIPELAPSKIVKGVKVPNDKLIVVRNTTQKRISRDLKEMCDLYNADGGRIYPAMEQLGPSEFAVTFPYDIDFETFCYIVNYLCYPVSGGALADVTGWTTAGTGDKWITEQLAGKRLMLYIPDDDDEYDNVYVAAEGGGRYKFGFGGNTEFRTRHPRPYQEPIKIEK